MVLFRDVLKSEDAERIEQIVRGTAVFNIEEIKIARELAEETLLKGTAQTGYHFLFSEDVLGNTTGYACYGRIPLTDSSYDLYWIAVAPEFQGQGIARALLDRVKDHVAELNGSFLYAETSGRPDYAAAHKMYEQSGFVLAARLKDFYRTGDDKLIECFSIK